MRRILLVIEDYNELLFVEKILKKVGFDIESLPSESSLPERMMGFLPDLVIATGDGNRINGHSVSKKVKRKGIKSLLLLLFSRQQLQQIDIATFAADGAIETPINPRALIKAVCDFTGVPAATILTKFDKLPASIEIEAEELKIISGHKQEKKEIRSVNGESRSQRYKKLLENAAPSDVQLFDRKAVDAERKYQKSIPDTPQELALDEERKDFVRNLYKGWKRK